MKKMFSSLLIALTLVTFTPGANATVGALTGAKLLAGVGGVSMITGVPVMKLANRLLEKARESKNGKLKVAGIFAGLIGGLIFIGGAYLLDGENDSFEFTPIQGENLTEDQKRFNEQLEEINAVKDLVAKAITEKTAEEDFNSIEEANEFVAAKWAEFGESISPEALRERERIAKSIQVQ